MKTSIKTIITAAIMGSALNGVAPAFVQASSFISPVAVVPSVNESLLHTAALSQFETFMHKRAANFVKTADWKVFTEVVKQYNENPGAVIQLSQEKRIAFRQASVKLNARLAKINGTDALAWYHQTSRTQQAINFWWSFNALSLISQDELEMSTGM